MSGSTFYFADSVSHLRPIWVTPTPIASGCAAGIVVTDVQGDVYNVLINARTKIMTRNAFGGDTRVRLSVKVIPIIVLY